MNNKQVIPQVGQVWIENCDGVELPLGMPSFRNGELIKVWRGTRGLPVKYFYDNFTFKPSTDLEFLAINCDTWDDEYRLVAKYDESYDFSNSCTIEGDYTRQQWQDKRNELFGETEMKPKMKVSYEVCKFNHAWEAVKAYQEDEDILFCDVHGHYENLPHAIAAHKAFNGDNLYRKIETPITWQGVLEEFFTNPSEVRGEAFAEFKMFNDGGELTESEFKEMCRLVVGHVGMTDKPE